MKPANDTRDGDRATTRSEHELSTTPRPDFRRPAMIRRVTGAERIRHVDPALWRVTLNEPPSRDWQRRFLEHACLPGLFLQSPIRIGDTTVVFELEEAFLRVGLERIDAWIGEANAAGGDPVEEAGHPSSTETILVVDDERGIRALASDILEGAGFTLADTGDPREALRIAQARTIHLLLTDVVMPVMNGRELAERMESLSRQTRVLFMSAYSSRLLPPGVPFIAKPFSPPALVRAVRDVLSRRSPFSRPKV